MTYTTRTVYSYNCQQCGRRVRMANYVKKCVRCGKTLCRRCSRKFGYCPTDWNQMLPEDQGKFRRWKRGLVLRALVLVLFTGAMIGILAATMDFLGTEGAIGLMAGFFVGAIILAIVIARHAGRKIQLRAGARFGARN